MNAKRYRTRGRNGNHGGSGKKRGTRAANRDLAQATPPARLDWLTPRQSELLADELIRKAMDKYGFDEETAREWAHIVCGDDENAVQTAHAAV